MTSLGNWVILARARTVLGARKSFSVLLVTAMSAAGLTAVAAAGPARQPPARPAHSCGRQFRAGRRRDHRLAE